MQQRSVRQPGRAHLVAYRRDKPFANVAVMGLIRIRLQFQHQAGMFIFRLRDQLQQLAQSWHPDPVQLRLIGKSAPIIGGSVKPPDIEPCHLFHPQRRHAWPLSVQKRAIRPPDTGPVKLVVMGNDGHIIGGEKHIEFEEINTDRQGEIKPDDAVLRQYATRAAMSDNADGVRISGKRRNLWGFHQPANLMPLAGSKR